MIVIRKGLNLPITGHPEQRIDVGNAVRSVALLGADYHGMKPSMRVKEGDDVKLGQVLFEDKKTQGVLYTAPGAGRVVAVNRGDKRVLQSVVIELRGEAEETFPIFSERELTIITRSQIVENLVRSGLWTAIRTRPFSRVPSLSAIPHSIFVTAIDTNPLAANPERYLDEQRGAFVNGLKIIGRLTEGPLYLCKAPKAKIPGSELKDSITVEFDGAHPAGLAGTHIHFLDPVSLRKTVWYLNYQDVIAVGKLFTTGRLFVDRVVALAGPEVKQPRLIRTRIGANIDDLLMGELSDRDYRAVSGSVLCGRRATGAEAYLGRYHLQISVLAEGRKRELLGWALPGLNKFSVKNAFLSKLIKKKSFAFTTSAEGSRRAIVPVGSYEKVMPLDIQPTFLLKALIVGDTDKAQALGCLELDEEDLGLCTFVCPGKYEYGAILRENLMRIEKEG
jgi:Na+-transporting NADH:ubiquinone oxidoreductase subunit A